MHYSAEQLLHSLGQRVRGLRQSRGWTQNELARRAGVSPRFLLEVEKGDANISLLRLTEVAAALEVSLAMLVGGYLSSRGGAQDGAQGGGGMLGSILGAVLGGGQQAAPASGGGLLGGLGSLIDMNHDGNPLDDIIGMAGKLAR